MIYIFYILFYPASSTFSIARGFSLFDERDILMAWMNDVSFKLGSKSIWNHPIVTTFREGTARSRRWFNFSGGKDLWCWKVNICGEWELYKSFFSLFSYLRTKYSTMLVSFFFVKKFCEQAAPFLATPHTSPRQRNGNSTSLSPNIFFWWLSHITR